MGTFYFTYNIIFFQHVPSGAQNYVFAFVIMFIHCLHFDHYHDKIGTQIRYRIFIHVFCLVVVLCLLPDVFEFVFGIVNLCRSVLYFVHLNLHCLLVHYNSPMSLGAFPSQSMYVLEDSLSLCHFSAWILRSMMYSLHAL